MPLDPKIPGEPISNQSTQTAGAALTEQPTKLGVGFIIGGDPTYAPDCERFDPLFTEWVAPRQELEFPRLAEYLASRNKIPQLFAKPLSELPNTPQHYRQAVYEYILKEVDKRVGEYIREQLNSRPIDAFLIDHGGVIAHLAPEQPNNHLTHLRSHLRPYLGALQQDESELNYSLRQLERFTILLIIKNVMDHLKENGLIIFNCGIFRGEVSAYRFSDPELQMISRHFHQSRALAESPLAAPLAIRHREENDFRIFEGFQPTELSHEAFIREMVALLPCKAAVLTSAEAAAPASSVPSQTPSVLNNYAQLQPAFKAFLSEDTQEIRHQMLDKNGKHPSTDDYWNRLDAAEQAKLKDRYDSPYHYNTLSQDLRALISEKTQNQRHALADANGVHPATEVYWNKLDPKTQASLIQEFTTNVTETRSSFKF